MEGDGQGHGTKVSLKLLNPEVQAGNILKKVETSPVLNILLYH